jgi:hypothetical protein
LDACPDPVYHGEVVKLAPMAIPQPGAPDIRIFEMLGTLREEDGRLRPGMSVEVGVVALPEVLSIPLGAVSAREEQVSGALPTGRSFVPLHMELGQRNTTAAVVSAGFREGDLIALKDPIRP